MGVLHFYSIENSIDLIGTCLKILQCRTYVHNKTGTLLLVTLLPCYYRGVYFATPWCWRPLAPKGATTTVSPNPSAKNSSRGLRQCCLSLVRADSCGGVSNSIVLSLVHIFPFYFSGVQPLHPFCPVCVDPRRAPLPSRFPSPSSSLWQRHCRIALALPVPVWRHANVPLPLPCQHHLCICIVTTTTATVICLSPCHCCWCMSLTSDASSLTVLANADANAVIVSPRLWQHQRQRHCCMFFCCPCHSMLPS